MNHPLPKLVTFDGEARSGKGTIVQTTKDYLRDECGYEVMLIDAGQVFRVLVVGATRAGVDVNDPGAIDAFLADEAQADARVQLVKDVYHMEKAERDALLYTNEVGENSAKIGARPLSQDFKDNLVRKWLADARAEGFEVVLLDGRALEETGKMLEERKLCDFVLGFYFVCDPVVGARRTLGFAATAYDDLEQNDKTSVDQLVVQINSRNDSDRLRKVQPIVPPEGATRITLPDVPEAAQTSQRPMYVVDTGAEVSKAEMSLPIAKLVANTLKQQN